MEPMQDKDFDQLFKQRFDKFEVEPSSRSWESITKQLEDAGKKRKNYPVYWMAAASVIILTSAVLWLLKPVEVIKLKGHPQIAVAEKHTDIDRKLENEALDKIEKREIVTEPPVRQKSFLAVRKANKVESKSSDTKELKVSENKAASSRSQVLLAKQEMLTTSDDGITALSLEADPVVLAQINTSQDESFNEAEALKPKIKSIGGLVNFVIAQVDKRDDKIIEFKDGHEGAEVSGINLGPLKFKSRK